MGKSLEALLAAMKKVRENRNGSLSGGFASVSNGINQDLAIFSANDGCTNSGTCFDDNTDKGGMPCRNSGNCSKLSPKCKKYELY